MKKMTAVLFAVIIGLCVFAQGQTGSSSVSLPQIQVVAPQMQAITPIDATNSVMSPLDVARAFALKTPDAYHGYLSCNMLISNQWTWTYMEWDMDKDFLITTLMVNNVQIPLPEPIDGLPMGDGGMARGANLNIYAMTKEGEYAGSGNLQKDVVMKGDSLIVTLTPASITMVLPVDVTGNNSVQLTIDGFTYGYGYWTDNGKLYVSLPPVGGSYTYVVRDSNGNIIGSGLVKPFHVAIAPNNAYTGVNLLGNVVGAEFPQADGYDSWTTVPSANLDCSIPTSSGSNVLGKVIFVDAGSGGLEVVINGDFLVFVQSATANDGDMPFLQMNDDSSYGQGGYSQTRLSTTTMNVGKAVITIIPKPTNSVEQPWINLHRNYGPVNGPIKG